MHIKIKGYSKSMVQGHKIESHIEAFSERNTQSVGIPHAKHWEMQDIHLCQSPNFHPTLEFVEHT